MGAVARNSLKIHRLRHLDHGALGPEEAEAQFPQPAGVFAVPEEELPQALVFPEGRLLIHDHLGDQENREIQLQLDLQEMADGVFPGLEETLPEPYLVHQEEEGAALFLDRLVEIAVLERIGPGPAPGKIIDGGGDDLHQVGQGLPHPEVQVKGHLRGNHSQLLVAPVEKEEVQVAAVFQGIDHGALAGQVPEPLQIARVHRDPFEERVQGVAQQEPRAAGEVPGVMEFLARQPAGQAAEDMSHPGFGLVGLRGLRPLGDRFFQIGAHAITFILSSD